MALRQMRFSGAGTYGFQRLEPFVPSATFMELKLFHLGAARIHNARTGFATTT